MRVLALACAFALIAPPALAGTEATVDHVVDGDTIVLAGGLRVRLLQVDATELGSGECYSRKAAAVLRGLLPPGTRVRLEAEARLGTTDRFGRALRYVFRGPLNVDVDLVRRGAATVWFYGGRRGRYAAALLAAMRGARDHRRGMWGSCRIVWNPDGPATTYGGGSPPPPGAGSACNPSYRPCLPNVADLDCADIPDSKKPVHLVGDADPYHLDADGDGLGCEG